MPAQYPLNALRGSGAQRGNDLLVIVVCALGQFGVLFADPPAIEKIFAVTADHFE